MARLKVGELRERLPKAAAWRGGPCASIDLKENTTST
jgi:hypothetical protein